MAESNYHVLLIGIDNYTAVRPLAGCVNDIDAIEALLFDAPGIGNPAVEIKPIRLAAPRPDAPTTTRLAAQTRAPTRDNILGALADLAGEAVQPGDRVLIYYSGHGGQGSGHESLVPVAGDLILDVELNARLKAIANRTGDLTVVLDCCHSSGATKRGLDEVVATETVAVRGLRGDEMAALSMPAMAGAGAASAGGGVASAGGGVASAGGGVANSGGVEANQANAGDTSTGMTTLDDSDVRGIGTVDGPEAPYVVIAACQSSELAGEASLEGSRHGHFTRGLLAMLTRRDAQGRAGTRWADIWPILTATVDDLATQPPATGNQHPWLSGRAERRIFGGPWVRQDPGFTVTRNADGAYHIAAGTVMGVTQGAELAVYGAAPPEFPPVGSAADKAARLGVVTVGQADRSSAVAQAAGAAFELPEGARARVVKPGQSERLRVKLAGFGAGDTAAVQRVNDSPFLERVESGEEVVVTAGANGWVIANEVEAELATVPNDQPAVLRLALDAYARYNDVLRLTGTCVDTVLNGKVWAKLLRVDDPTGFVDATGADFDAKLDGLPEVTPVDGAYDMEEGLPFCVTVKNTYQASLLVTLLNCSAGGRVEYLGDREFGRNARESFWLQDIVGQAFVASPSRGRPRGVDRLLIVATTRLDVSLSGLEVRRDLEEVVAEALKRTRGDTKDVGERNLGDVSQVAPVERWKAQELRLVMHR